MKKDAGVAGIDRGRIDTKITADMPIAEVLEKYPETVDVFTKYFRGGCFACPAARFENISDGASAHGLDVKEILDELNSKVVPASK